jgi:ubiquitin C-terminal hydrolase
MEKYDEKSELQSFGFNNMGATCYFNSVLQSLMSCTSFTTLLTKNVSNTKFLENPVTKFMIELIISARDESKKNLLCQYSPRIWKEMVIYLSRKNKKDVREILVGQQCAREGFHCLMDALEEFNEIQKLFLHKYKTSIHCFICNEWVSKTYSTYSIFEVQHDLKTEQLDHFKKYDTVGTLNMNKFLQQQSSFVDKDYKCPKCKDTSEKYIRNDLVMIPEILPVLSKKYSDGMKLNVFTDFPLELSFKGNHNNVLKYKAVSQIEHTGGLNGGHYWSISKRNDGWYTLNDANVSKSEFKPTKSTYIVFYHYYE